MARRPQAVKAVVFIALFLRFIARFVMCVAVVVISLTQAVSPASANRPNVRPTFEAVKGARNLLSSVEREREATPTTTSRMWFDSGFPEGNRRRGEYRRRQLQATPGRAPAVTSIWRACRYDFPSARTTSPELVATKPRVCPGNSFTADTHVLMADGTTKEIEDVVVGDLVFATDPETGRTEARKVVALITGEGEKELVDVVMPSGDRVEIIVATKGHPFWVSDKGAWIKADDLRAGDDLRQKNGSTLEVLAVRKHTELVRVYNLSIEGIHTFYVASGEASVLVHNQNAGWPVIPPDAEVRVLTPHSNGGAQYGVEYKWYDSNGRKNLFRVHGPDLTAPVGSNAAKGNVAVWQIGKSYVGPDGKLYPPGVVNPASSNYDPVAANDVHRPWPGGCP
jgi:hypothetical protein